MSENVYCVYMYTNKVNGKKYIGQTSQTLQERSGSNGKNYRGCRYFYKSIQKYGWKNFERCILVDGLTLEQANEKEDEYIKLYKTENREFGYNLKGGGANPKFNEETRKRLSQAQMGENNGFYGKKHDEKTRRIMSQNHYDCNGEKNPNYGKKHTAEAKERMRTSRKGKHILQYDLDGNFIKEWEYMSLAIKECGLDKRSLQRACQGVLKTTGGYIWRYKEV